MRPYRSSMASRAGWSGSRVWTVGKVDGTRARKRLTNWNGA